MRREVRRSKRSYRGEFFFLSRDEVQDVGVQFTQPDVIGYNKNYGNLRVFVIAGV